MAPASARAMSTAPALTGRCVRPMETVGWTRVGLDRAGFNVHSLNPMRSKILGGYLRRISSVEVARRVVFTARGRSLDGDNLAPKMPPVRASGAENGPDLGPKSAVFPFPVATFQTKPASGCLTAVLFNSLGPHTLIT
eukprot:scaffold1449_cov324-Prasinococcus_capsulatus_cf.AAC.1